MQLKSSLTAAQLMPKPHQPPQAPIMRPCLATWEVPPLELPEAAVEVPEPLPRLVEKANLLPVNASGFGAEFGNPCNSLIIHLALGLHLQ
mmetsp:Transcript_106800/g.185579  ORF Transcript_106800/g.185579 Transcript_106800/m.185579 type:complete len:90 (-) Transcript_106800:57-326(-)